MPLDSLFERSVLTRPSLRPRFVMVATTSPLISGKVRLRIVPASSIRRKSTWASSVTRQDHRVIVKNNFPIPRIRKSASCGRICDLIVIPLERSPLAYRSTYSTAGTRSGCHVFLFHHRRTCLSLSHASPFYVHIDSHLSLLPSDIGITPCPQSSRKFAEWSVE